VDPTAAVGLPSPSLRRPQSAVPTPHQASLLLGPPTPASVQTYRQINFTELLHRIRTKLDGMAKEDLDLRRSLPTNVPLDTAINALKEQEAVVQRMLVDANFEMSAKELSLYY
jgi:hypothetical protein